MAISGTLVSLGTFVAIYALLSLGLNIKFGYGGLLDIGHVTFYLLGAYVTALLVAPPAADQQFADYVLGLDLAWIVAVPIAVVVAAVAGMLIALPAIRLREDYLAITVLGFSVIAKRVIQTQGWLANGPGSLRNYPAPLRGAFPLPGGGESITLVGLGVPPEALFGVVVLILWAVGTYVLGEFGRIDSMDSIGDRVFHAVFAVTTLGVGYLAARRLASGTERVGALTVGSGLVAGVVAAGLSLTGSVSVGVLLTLGLFSVFTWLLAARIVFDHYDGMPARDAVAALGLAVAFVGAFLPLILLGGEGGNEQSRIGLIVTVVLLLVFVYGLVYLSNHWEGYGSGSAFISVVGVGALWLFVIRYFLLALVTPFKQGGASEALGQLFQNLTWLIQFSGGDPAFNYARFVFTTAIAVVGAAYYLMEITVASPFGRVLKAIRDDEDAATALGKNTFVFKIQSMMLGSALAGLAGALWALSVGALVHTMFAPRITFIVFLMVIIGGTANNRGVLLGSVIYWGFQKGTEDIAGFFPPEARSSVQALRIAFIGALLIVILYYRPEGIWGEQTTASSEVES